MTSDTERTPPAPKVVTFTFTSQDTGEPYTIQLEVSRVRTLAEVVEKWGPAQALDLLVFGASVAGCDISDAGAARLERVLASLPRSTIGQADNMEEWVLWRTYTWLRDKRMTRPQAAQYASDVLRKTISTDAWRKAVDRWAAKEGFPKVEMYKRSDDKTDRI